MNEIGTSTTLALLVTTVLLVQGVSIAVRAGTEEHTRWFGFLTVLLACLGFVCFVLFTNAIAIFSPELSLIMAQGGLGKIGLILLIIGISFMAGLSWRVGRLASGWRGRLPYLLLASLAIGIFAISFGMHTLNPHAPPEFRVYYYDIWWPPLIIWVTVCFFESGLILLRLDRKLVRWFLAALTISIFGIWATSQPWHEIPPASDPFLIWAFLVLFFVPVSSTMGGLLAFKLSPDNRKTKRRVGRWSFAALGALIGFVASAFIVSSKLKNAEPGLATLFADEELGDYGWVLWLGWFGFVILIRVATVYFSGKKSFAERVGQMWQKLQLITLKQLIYMAALTLIGASLIFSFYNIGDVNPAIPFITFFTAWALLSELVAKGFLFSVYRLFKERQVLETTQTKAQNTWKWCIDHTGGVGDKVLDVLKMPSTGVATAKILIVLALLIAISELPNSGKTLVMKFDTPNTEAYASQDIGQQISERLIFSLTTLGSQIQTEVIFQDTASHSPKKDGVGDFSPQIFVSSSNISSGLETAISKSSDLKVGNTQIPLGFLAAPIKGPMRWLLGVQVISGSLHESKGGYTLVASSSKGSSWIIDEPDGSTQTNTAIPSPQVLTPMLNELAFEIISRSQNIESFGMTHSWDAFKAFLAGVDEYNKFEEGSFKSYTHLAKAIDNFRSAVNYDPFFALAHYRLGLAFKQNFQPQAAVNSLERAIEVNREFSPAYNALALTLRDFDYYYYNTAQAKQLSSSEQTIMHRGDKSQRIWHDMLKLNKHTSNFDKGVAYNGLGSFELAYVLDVDAETPKFPLTYFYFKRALHYYNQSVERERHNPGIIVAIANVLNNIGVLLDSGPVLLEDNAPLAEDSWHCYEGSFSPGHYTNAALLYYKSALKIYPVDFVIRCNEATSATNLGDSRSMEVLARDSGSVAYFAQWRSEFTSQLIEYDKAIELNPLNTSALNSYAYKIWFWTYSSIIDEGVQGPDSIELQKAEDYARTAVQLTHENDPARIMYQGTLGEVLLGSGKFEEAVTVLEAVLKDAPNHPLLNESRWDLAQAHLCMATKLDAESQETDQHILRAEELFMIIQDLERSSEYKPYSKQKTLLDTGVPGKFCRENET